MASTALWQSLYRAALAKLSGMRTALQVLQSAWQWWQHLQAGTVFAVQSSQLLWKVWQAQQVVTVPAV